MPEPRTRKPIDDWFGEKIAPGESRDVTLVVGESYSGMNVQIPIHIRRAREDGPVVFVSAAIHGDEINEKGYPVATNTTLLGQERSVLTAPFDAVVIGMTTLPAISPGEPVCHLDKLPKGAKPSALRRLRHEAHGLEQRVSEELGSNVLVVEPS